MRTSPPPSTRYLPLSFQGKFSTPAPCSTPYLWTVLVIYLYCPSPQQGSVCPCPSWVTCKWTRRVQHGEKNKICLWAFPVPQQTHLLVFITCLHCLHFSHNYCLFSSQAHPPLHLPVRNSTFPKLISTPFLSLLLTNHILFLLSWVLFLCWEELRFWLYVRNTNHHRSICRHINPPESQVGSGTHTYISLPKT